MFEGPLNLADGPTAEEAAPGARWAELALLSVAVLLSMSTWFSAAAVLPQLKSAWHLSGGTESLLTISVQVGFVLGAAASASLNLADVLGPRRLFCLGSIAAGVANLLVAVSGGPDAAIALRCLTGISLALVYPSGLKAMSTWFGRGRGTALGIMVGALTVGSALPYLVSAAVSVDWQWVTLVTSALTVGGGLIAEVAVRDGPMRFPDASFDPRHAPLALANRGVRLASLGYFGHNWELYGMWAWFSVFFSWVLGLHREGSSRLAALATFAVIGVGGIGCLVGGLMSDRLGRTLTTIVCLSASALCSVVIGSAAYVSVLLTFLIALIWGFWIVADSAQFSTMVTETADQRYVGTALTLQLAIGFALTTLTIYLIPVLSGVVSWRWAFAFLAPGPLLSVLAMMRLRRAPEAALIAGGRR